MKTQRRKAAEKQTEELDFAPWRLGASALNASATATISKVEEAELPEGWRIRRLGELIRRPQYGLTASATDDANGQRFLRITDIQDSGVNWATVPSCECDVATFEQVKLLPGDLVVARIGATTGKAHLIRDKVNAVFASYLIRLRANDGLEPEFLHCFTNSSPYWRQIDAVKGGRLKQGVIIPLLESLQLALPPLPEQRAIAGVLRTVPGAKEACERVLAATRQLKQSLHHHLFTYGPVPFPQAAHVPLKETEIGLIPESWQTTNLEMLKAAPKGAIVSGPFGSNIGKRFFVPSGVPLIRGCNLTTGKALFVEEGFVFITEEKAHELANCTALPGDLVFTAAGTIGQVGLIPEKRRDPKYVISNKQLRARVDTAKGDPLFLFYWFTQLRMQAMMLERKSGTSIPVINLSVLRSLPIGLPPPSEQREIARQLAAVDAKLAALASRRAALAALFTSLLPTC